LIYVLNDFVGYYSQGTIFWSVLFEGTGAKLQHNIVIFDIYINRGSATIAVITDSLFRLNRNNNALPFHRIQFPCDSHMCQTHIRT
jgi:hypothetical protein